MNVFVPYESMYESVKCLDDKRLNKQILEAYQMLDIISKGKTTGYANHPVTKFYQNYPHILKSYAIQCCYEYHYRFNKSHKCMSLIHSMFPRFTFDSFITLQNVIYVAGSKTSNICVRETEPKRVNMLFQHKLADKWLNDLLNNRPPKWTNRQVPNLYIYALENYIRNKKNYEKN